MNAAAITIVEREKAALMPVDYPPALGEKDVRGRTLASLVSPGTELAWNYAGTDTKYPNRPGYSSVFEVEQVGSAVQGIRAGDRLFCLGGHRSIQQVDAANTIPVPDGLSPEEATIARLMGVSMTTLMTTAARPGDIVVITGLGPVGYLAAHLFAVSGYDVRAVEPNATRRAMAEGSGLKTLASLAGEAHGLTGRIAMVVECSGHEQAVLDGARAVRPRGEVVLVGVPWRRCTDLHAHDVLHAVFHKYVVLRSGWEWEVPFQEQHFQPHSIMSGLRLAMRWLSEKRIPLDGCLRLHRPQDAQAVYQSLLRNTGEGLFQVFDWTERDDKDYQNG